MSHSTHYGVLLIAAAVAALLGEADGIGFNLHHRSSPVVQRWAEARGHAPGSWWPKEAAHGTPEYYSALSRNDRALFARRGLAAGRGRGELAFAGGNASHQLDEFLYYAEVAVGTPKATFVVALDTGSDLFWLPCDCIRCAPKIPVYIPSRSSTSKPITCGDALCNPRKACATRNSSCPYTFHYLSANTSTSGVLVEDVLHLSREKQRGAGEAVQAPIVLGCGREQTGAFLEGDAVADGLMGLGRSKVSVPSLLAASGLVASDSFSMCFSEDGVGRINFGDAGSPGQSHTPFFNPAYNIHIMGMNVQNSDVPLEFNAVVDSGTSFTYLPHRVYGIFAHELMSRIKDTRANFSTFTPFEYCYRLSPNKTDIAIPDVHVSFLTKGGARFPVTQPFVHITDQDRKGQVRDIGYCLGILKSDISLNFFGQNFMTGLKVVFDRERSVLGWQKFDCYRGVPQMKNIRSTVPAPVPTTA